jgi:hypothetical protein
MLHLLRRRVYLPANDIARPAIAVVVIRRAIAAEAGQPEAQAYQAETAVVTVPSAIAVGYSDSLEMGQF